MNKKMSMIALLLLLNSASLKAMEDGDDFEMPDFNSLDMSTEMQKEEEWDPSSYKDFLLNPTTISVENQSSSLRKMTYNTIWGVNKRKHIFGEGEDRIPSQYHLYQKMTLDCGVLAPIAAMASTNEGKHYIQTIMNDKMDAQENIVDIQLYDYLEKKPMIYRVQKERDYSWNKSSQTRLWVHLLERGIEKALHKDLPTYRKEGGVNAFQTFKILLGHKIVQYLDDGFYNEKDIDNKTLQDHFLITDNNLHRFSVLVRHSHDQDKATLRDGIFNDHYYAITGHVTEQAGKKGVMVFNTLNKSNYTTSYFSFSYPTDREFFVSLEDLPKKFSTIRSVHVNLSK